MVTKIFFAGYTVSDINFYVFYPKLPTFNYFALS